MGTPRRSLPPLPTTVRRAAVSPDVLPACVNGSSLVYRVKLLGEAATLPGKKIVSDAVGVVIERVQEKVKDSQVLLARFRALTGQILPFLPTLAHSVPALCESFSSNIASATHTAGHGASGLEGEWLFKASLVDLTTKIVTASRSSRFHSVVLTCRRREARPAT